MPVANLTRVSVNLPPALYNRLRKAAKAEGCSISALIVSRLDRRIDRGKGQRLRITPPKPANGKAG